jgi:TPR repeat protein
MVWTGEGVEKAPTQSARMFARSCELGWAEGCANLATTLAMGVGVEKNPAKAVELAIASCHEGVARACTMAGLSTLQGDGVPADPSRAVALMRAGCRGGDQNGCSTLGVMVLGKMGGLAYDERLAAGLFKQACDGGVVIGCTNFGYMVEFGKGVPKNLKLASSIYGRACSAAPAECVWNGILAQGAIDRTYDPQKARDAFHASCSVSPDNPGSAAEAVACVIMNEVFNEKVQVNQAALRDGVTAWKETCSTGTERDCTLLGVSAWGLGDVAAAKKFVAEGCRLGDPWACSLRGHDQLK